MGSARHRRRSGKKLLGFEARGGVYGGNMGAKPQAKREIADARAHLLARGVNVA